MKKTLIALLLTLCLVLPAAALAEETYTIGIAQFAVHASLDNCREGFIQGLADAGFVEGENVTFIVQNAQADSGAAAQIAQSLVAQNCDLICAIATPMAAVCFNTADDKIPIVYSAVSAPVEAELATEDGLGTGNATGTSDLLPVAAQLSTIRELLPEATSIGILYTTSETNSHVQLALYEELAGEYGFEIVSGGISTGADIQLALAAMLGNVDCLTMLTDNTVVQYLDVVLDMTDERGIPVFGSEVEQLEKGCVAAEGLDYVALGRKTGELAARVLGGESAQSIPYVPVSDNALYLNPTACAALDIEIPASVMQRATLLDAQ